MYGARERERESNRYNMVIYEGKTSEPAFHRPLGNKILHLKLLVGPRVWLVCSPPPAALANPRLVVVRHT